MIYGVICFAALFSFIGTVLGGLWADDSWGRFWGWDPKENGALIIVLWNALILHALWDRMVRDRGLAVLAVAGNIVTAWSWFGVNELGVGLHSYGFTEGVLLALRRVRRQPVGHHRRRLPAPVVVAGAEPRTPGPGGDGLRSAHDLSSFSLPFFRVGESTVRPVRLWPRARCHGLAASAASGPAPDGPVMAVLRRFVGFCLSCRCGPIILEVGRVSPAQRNIGSGRREKRTSAS